MPKRFVLSVLVLFVLTVAGGFAVHGGILGPDYARLASQGIYRTTEAARPLMAFMLLANLSLAIGLTWIYRVGRDGRHWAGQGLRFGLAIAVLCTVPTYLTYYVVTPMPGDLVLKQILWSALEDFVLGLAAAFVNSDPRPEEQPV